MTEKPLTASIMARHSFTTAELLALGERLNGALQEQAQIESEFASIKADFKSRITRMEAEQQTASQKLRDKFEMRETLAVVILDAPAPGRKSFYFAVPESQSPGEAMLDEPRMTAGEFIRDEQMTAMDRQRELPLEEKPRKIDDPRPQSKDVLPLGCVLVTEGDALEGDWVWVEAHQLWEAVAYEPGISAASYAACARPLANKQSKVGFSDDTEGMTPLAKALNEVAVGTELKRVPFDIDPVDDPKAIAKKFVKAAGKAEWPQPCIALLRDAVNKCATSDKAAETLAPHIVSTTAETQTGSE